MHVMPKSIPTIMSGFHTSLDMVADFSKSVVDAKELWIVREPQVYLEAEWEIEDGKDILDPARLGLHRNENPDTPARRSLPIRCTVYLHCISVAMSQQGSSDHSICSRSCSVR